MVLVHDETARSGACDGSLPSNVRTPPRSNPTALRPRRRLGPAAAHEGVVVWHTRRIRDAGHRIGEVVVSARCVIDTVLASAGRGRR